MTRFLTTEQPPSVSIPRRERPYYHRHELRKQATWIDWLIALAVSSVVAGCVSWFGGWPA